MKAKTKAFGYLRTSGKGQVGNDGFPRQRDAIVRYAKTNGIQMVQEFTDEAVSGTTDAMDRAGLTDLFVALKANGVRTVLVENATRLARDRMISEIILGEFRKIGVKVISADGGLDLTLGNDDPSGKRGSGGMGKMCFGPETPCFTTSYASCWSAVRREKTVRTHARGSEGC